MVKTSGIPQTTFYNWWKAFCTDTGLDLPPRRALGLHQQQCSAWLDAQHAKAEGEKQRREAEARALRQQEEFDDAKEFLNELIQKYGHAAVWHDVIQAVFPEAVSP